MIYESSEIAAEREKLGIGRDRLAALSGVSASRIGKIEREGHATEVKLKQLTVALQKARGGGE